MLRGDELRRIDAVLHHHEADVIDFERGFLADFALQGGDGRLAAADLAARDTPFVAPFVGADHEHTPVPIMDEGTDGGDRSRRAVAARQQFAQHAEVRHGEVRPHLGQQFRMVVAGEHRDRCHAAVARGFHIVGHISHKGGFGRVEGVSFQNPVDHLAFVEHAGIGGFEKIAEAEFI